MAKVQLSNTLDVLDEVRPLTTISGQVATPELKGWILGNWAWKVWESSQVFTYTNRSIGCSTKEKGLTPYLYLNLEIEEKNEAAWQAKKACGQMPS